MSKNFYITTTLPYVNSDPHIGFAMEIIRADVIARVKESQGYDVFFNTGTDEHGLKLYQKAYDLGESTQNYVDRYVKAFEKLKDLLNLKNDIHFVRTTNAHHKNSAQEFWKICADNGYIYKKNYKAKYCVGCELERLDSDLVDGRCFLHPNIDLVLIDEENYFFKFSSFQDKLLELYKENPDFVIPDFRFNEIKSFVKNGLEDFSISRLKEKMPWGVDVPGDPEHVMYVWFDALVNYISTLGWPENKENFEKFWVNGTPIQYCGKDNLRQQSAMWQAMLMAANLPNTKHIIVNGFITAEGGLKMSKSLGNTIDPNELVKEYGTDAVRYFLLREISNFEDSPFTIERFKDAYNAGLANGLGNLTSRIMNMVAQYGVDISGRKGVVIPDIYKWLEIFDIKKSIDEIWWHVNDIDKFIADKKPFSVFKTDPDKARSDVLNALYRLQDIAVSLEIFLPETSKKILSAIEINQKPENLFPRKD